MRIGLRSLTSYKKDYVNLNVKLEHPLSRAGCLRRDQRDETPLLLPFVVVTSGVCSKGIVHLINLGGVEKVMKIEDQ
mgnify:FL=1